MRVHKLRNQIDRVYSLFAPSLKALKNVKVSRCTKEMIETQEQSQRHPHGACQLFRFFRTIPVCRAPPSSAQSARGFFFIHAKSPTDTPVQAPARPLLLFSDLVYSFAHPLPRPAHWRCIHACATYARSVFAFAGENKMLPLLSALTLLPPVFLFHRADLHCQKYSRFSTCCMGMHAVHVRKSLNAARVVPTSCDELRK